MSIRTQFYIINISFKVIIFRQEERLYPVSEYIKSE